MVRLDVIETEVPSAEALEMLKAYAAVSAEGQDTLLMSMLKRAFSIVQKYADKALLAGKWRICADDHYGVVKVYMGGSVESVTDRHGLIAFRQECNEVYVGTEGYVEIVFTTTPVSEDYDMLLPVVLRYATALYDGKDTVELNRILKEC